MKGAFAQTHPAVGLAYYIAVIFLAAVIRAPLFLACALLAVVLVNITLDGGRQLRRYVKFYLLLAAVMTFMNPLFSHRGATTLFLLGDNRVTLEALIYGLTSKILYSYIAPWPFLSCFENYQRRQLYLLKALTVLSKYLFHILNQELFVPYYAV